MKPQSWHYRGIGSGRQRKEIRTSLLMRSTYERSQLKNPEGSSTHAPIYLRHPCAQKPREEIPVTMTSK
jgi:hypothetical protein